MINQSKLTGQYPLSPPQPRHAALLQSDVVDIRQLSLSFLSSDDIRVLPCQTSTQYKGGDDFVIPPPWYLICGNGAVNPPLKLVQPQ